MRRSRFARAPPDLSSYREIVISSNLIIINNEYQAHASVAVMRFSSFFSFGGGMAVAVKTSGHRAINSALTRQARASEAINTGIRQAADGAGIGLAWRNGELMSKLVTLISWRGSHHHVACIWRGNGRTSGRRENGKFPVAGDTGCSQRNRGRMPSGKANHRIAAASRRGRNTTVLNGVSLKCRNGGNRSRANKPSESRKWRRARPWHVW